MNIKVSCAFDNSLVIGCLKVFCFVCFRLLFCFWQTGYPCTILAQDDIIKSSSTATVKSWSNSDSNSGGDKRDTLCFFITCKNVSLLPFGFVLAQQCDIIQLAFGFSFVRTFLSFESICHSDTVILWNR